MFVKADINSSARIEALSKELVLYGYRSGSALSAKGSRSPARATARSRPAVLSMQVPAGFYAARLVTIKTRHVES